MDKWIFLFWALSIVTVLIVAFRFQQNIVQKTEDEIKIKEDQIEKTVDSESLNQLVDSNNKDKS